MGEQDFGNKVHKTIEGIVNAQHDPDFTAEISYHPNPSYTDNYGARGSIRLDVLEKLQIRLYAYTIIRRKIRLEGHTRG